MEADEITLEIDLIAGTAKITAPKDAFADAAKEARELLALRRTGEGDARPATPSGAPRSISQAAPSSTPEPAKRASRVSGGSSGRPGRIGSFDPVNFGFNEDQERALHSFYQEKRPSTSSEKAATAMFAGERASGQKVFDYNSIYTLMRLGGEKDLPKALDVVMSAMKKDNWVAADEGGFSLKFLARDHVESKLPSGAS